MVEGGFPRGLPWPTIAQVHRARPQSDGTEVIIKVQHAGIEQRMAADIIILRQLLEWLKKLEPDFDMTAIARQWMKAIPEELDFEHEAANMVEMARCLEASAPAQQRSAPIPRLSSLARFVANSG